LTNIIGEVTKSVNDILDPETGLTLGAMELIQKIEEREQGALRIEFVPTSPFCPIALKFAMDIKKAALSVQGVIKVEVYVRGHNMEQQINQLVNQTKGS
jgi:metal-sulfur cluster biosynthetic enzyme